MKNYKMLIVLVSIILITVGVTVLVVYLNSIEKGNNFELGDYTVVSQGAGVAIVTYNGDETTLVVPNKIEGKKIVAIKENAFKNSKVVSLSFEEGANIDIEDSCFNGNTVIQEVTLPTTMTSIPKNCFMNCTSLNKVTMPDSIIFIGEYAFYGCTNLTKNYTPAEDGYRWLELPKSLKEICNSAFYECSSLDCVKVSDKLELIDNNAFRHSGLQKLALYDEESTFGVKEIGNYAFYSSYIYSNSTSKLSFPKLTKIGNYAFASTSNNFKYFAIPSSVTSIGDYAFSGSSSLITLVFESNEEGDVDLEVGKYVCASSTSLERVDLKRKMTSIPEGMFMGCIKLLYSNNLILPEEVKEIGPAAFAFFVTSSSSTKYCNYTIQFNHTNAQGDVSQVDYNDSFRVIQLQRYTNSTSSNLKHFIVTDYNITELYAYVGLYSKSSKWTYDSKEAVAFKFLLSEEYLPGTGTPKTFETISIIHNSAFAGAQFDKLCLPGAACNIEKNAFYKSDIDAIYIDGSCLDHTCDINENALDNMNTSLDKVRVFVKGTKSQRSVYNDSAIKKQFDAIKEELCEFTTEEWPK